MSTVASPRQEQGPTTAGVPKTWAWARVEDILVPGSPVVYGILQPGPDTPDGIPYIRPTEIDGDVIQVHELRRTVPTIAAKYKRSEVRAGDVILTIVGTIGKVAIVPDGLDGANITQSSSRLRADGRVLNSRYLAWTMRSPALRGQFDKLRLGTAVPRLNIAHVRDLLVPIAPLPEQRRIVAKIEELFSDLDAGVAALKRVRANLKRYRAAVLKAAVEGSLTEEWRTRHPATEPAAKLLERILAERRAKWEQDQLRKFNEAGKTPPKGWKEKYEEPLVVNEAGLSSVPRGWAWATVDQIVAEGLSNGISVRGADQPPGVAALKLNAMSANGFDYSAIRYIPINAQTAKDNAVREGDFFVSRGNGSLHLLARGTLAQKPPGLVVFPDTMIRMRLGNAIASSGWIPTAWPSRGVRAQIERLAKTTAGIYKVSQRDIASVALPVPPLAEQAEIVAEVDRRLSVADAAEQQVELALQRAARLRQAILKRAFEGKLVPQDPTDEPAAALLSAMANRTNEVSNNDRTVARTGKARAATPTRHRSHSRG